MLDDAQVDVQGRLQNIGDVKRPRFAKDGADRRIRIEHGFDAGIVFRSAFDAASRAECRDQRVLPLYIAGALEEFHILWIRAGPAAFNERHSQFIEPLRNANFIVGRKREAFRLRSVAQSRVVDLDLSHDADPASNAAISFSKPMM